MDYTPLDDDDFPVSTPAEQGLDPKLVARLYLNAAELESIYSLLVLKNGHLIAEGYFHEGSVEQLSARHSATKSVTSAVAGVAVDQGCMPGLDRKMIDFFPDYESRVRASDPRKEQITVRHLLQMRGGYPWDSDGAGFDALFWSGNWRWVPHIVDFPLVSDPGTEMQYSSLTSHLLGVIVQRECDTDLITLAEEHIFLPIDGEVGKWTRDVDNYNWGWGEIYLTARDMAKFGLLYLNDGEYEGNQIIPADWVHDSLQIYSENAWKISVGRNWRDNGYGYQWWSVRAGDHRYSLAWGHGGQQIVLLDEFDMVIVVTADPLYHQSGGGPWKHEKANLNLVGDFIASLPSE